MTDDRVEALVRCLVEGHGYTTVEQFIRAAVRAALELAAEVVDAAAERNAPQATANIRRIGRQQAEAIRALLKEKP